MEPEGSLPHSQVPATFQTLSFPFFILGIQQGLGIVTCNTKDLLVIDLVCVCFLQHFISEWLTAPPSELVPHYASALCFWVPLGGTGEHKALAWVGYKLWRWGNNLTCAVYYSKFLYFFSSLGRTLSESWKALHWGGCVPGVWT